MMLEGAYYIHPILIFELQLAFLDMMNLEEENMKGNTNSGADYYGCLVPLVSQ